jgi:hypothetical protein
MADLVNTIKRNSQLLKRGSQLFEAAPESLYQQVSKQGLAPGAVVSPQAAADTGLTPDQAKMAGSGAQVQKAIRESVEPTRQAPTSLFARTQASAQEQQRMAKAQQLQGLEALGGRISGLVNSYMQEASAKAAGAQAKADEAKIKNDLPNATPEQVAKIKSAIETGTIDAELWSLFPQAKSADELTTALKLYTKAAKEVVTETIKNTFGPDVTLAQLKPNDFAALGLQGLGDIATMLGMEEDKLRDLTIDQFQAKVNELVSGDFDRVQELMAIANDAFYPANLREQAKAELRDLSSVGVQASEQQVAQLNEAIQSADTITVGDEQMTVAELLADDGISSVIASYLDDTTGEYRKLLEEQYPDLVAFINKNQDALKAATAKLSDAAKASANIQQSNAKLEYSADGNVKMTDFNKLAFGAEYDPTKPSNTDWASKKTEAHKILDPETKEFSAEDKSAYAQFLNDMAKIAPDVLRNEFLNLNAAGLRAKLPPGQSLATYVNNLKGYYTNVKNLDPASGLSNEAAISQALGGEANLQTMVNTYKQLALFREMGFGDIPDKLKPVMAILDTAMADGTLDPNELAGVRVNLAQYLKSGYSVNDGKSLYDLVRDAGNSLTTDTYRVLWSKVKDGEITAEEAADLAGTNSINEISRLYDKLNAKGLIVTGDVAGTLSPAIEANIRTKLKDSGVNPDLAFITPDKQEEYLNTLVNPNQYLTSWSNLIRLQQELDRNKGIIANYGAGSPGQGKQASDKLIAGLDAFADKIRQRIETLNRAREAESDENIAAINALEGR